jgi:hypothetical protein
MGFSPVAIQEKFAGPGKLPWIATAASTETLDALNAMIP